MMYLLLAGIVGGIGAGLLHYWVKLLHLALPGNAMLEHDRRS